MLDDVTPQEFVQKWKARLLTERAGSHVHFIELCGVLGVPYPHENPMDDAHYCFDALTTTPGSRVYAATKGRARADKSTETGSTQADAQPPERSTAEVISADNEGRGWADVWKRDCFCWEYKRQGKHADLAAALRQLKEYKDSLYNPRLLVVCDIDNFEIHSNFTG